MLSLLVYQCLIYRLQLPRTKDYFTINLKESYCKYFDEQRFISYRDFLNYALARNVTLNCQAALLI